MDEKTPVPRHWPMTVFVRTLCVSFVVLCLIHAGLIALEPRGYRSEAVVEFAADSTNSVPQNLDYRQRLLPEFQTIESPELGGRVIEELQLDKVWGKRYNNGQNLSLHDASRVLSARMDLFSRPGTQKITIRVYGGDPVEPARIANSLAENYCNNFTKPRGISARILTPAVSTGKAIHAGLIFEIPKAIFRSSLIALLAAGIAWGFAAARIRLPPPIPRSENARSPFQKY